MVWVRAKGNMSTIRDGAIHYIVRCARENGYSEKEITEAAIEGIQKNIKKYKTWIEEGKMKGKFQEFWEKIYQEAETALEDLNEGHAVVYKGETLYSL